MRGISLISWANINKKEYLIDEWDYEKNEFKPNEVSYGTKKTVFWKCKNNHSFSMSVISRVRGQNCPYCSNRKILVGFNDLETTDPDLALEWDNEKNGNITPKQITRGSGTKVWWKCKYNHSFSATPNNRTSNNTQCPYCSGKKTLPGFNDLCSTNPDIIKEWNFDKNSMKPTEVSKGSNKYAWWTCSSCGHIWKAKINDRIGIRKSGCPQCATEQKSSFTEQAILFYVLKIYPDSKNRYIYKNTEFDVFIPSINTAIEYDGGIWHQNIKRDIKKNSFCEKENIKLIRIREADCPKLDETSNLTCYSYTFGDTKAFERIIYKIIYDLSGINISVNIDQDRTYIYNQYVSTKKKDSLESLFPEISKEWNYEKNGTVIPSMVFSKSNKKFWWMCPLGHSYEMKISNRVTQNQGCPYCSGRKILVGYNDLETQLKSEPTLIHLLKEWDYEKNTIKITTVQKGSHKKVWWVCDKGHSFSASINNRTTHLTKCPYCTNNKVLQGFNDLDTYIKINPQIGYLLEEWDYKKNQILPTQILPKSNLKIWWVCDKGHSFQSNLNNRINQKSNCPICNNMIKAKRLQMSHCR